MAIKKNEDLLLLVEICNSYYQYEETQSDIAKRLGISRATICKLLAQARNQGIVTIEINDPYKTKEKLEQELCAKFKLRDAVIVPVPRYGILNLKKEIGKVTGEVLRTHLRNGDTVGVSGGTTMYEVVSTMAPLDFTDITVAPLQGGLSEIEESIHLSEITRIFAVKAGGNTILLPAPGLVNDANARQLFISNPIIQKGLEIGRNCSIAIMGIGSVKPNATIFKFLAEADIAELQLHNAVGDLCLQFYDKNGKGITEFNSRVVGISLEEIKKIPLVIGVAGGGDKAEAIEGALKGGYIHILVTDQVTAEEIIAANS
jgi:deoxyribonucleoside regulator